MTMTKEEDAPISAKASMLRPPTPRSSFSVPALDLRKLGCDAPDAPRPTMRSGTPRSSRQASGSPRVSSPYQRAPSGHCSISSSPRVQRSVPSSPRGWATPRAPLSARSGSSTPRGGAATQNLPDGVKFAMDKLQSELKLSKDSVKQKELEIKALLSKVRDSTSALTKKSKICDGLQTRVLAAEQRQATTLKEYEMLKGEHVKLGNKLSSAERKLDRLTARVSNTSTGPNISIITKDLQSEIAELKRANKQLEGQVKTRDNMLRTKDKDFAQMELKMAEAESVKQKLGESENQCLYMKQQLENLREDVKTVLHVQQQKDCELQKLVEKSRKLELRMNEKQNECNKLQSKLDLANCDVSSLEAELHVTSEALHRTEKVAARVARFEHEDGLHGEGTVPYQLFAHETSYLKGEIKRLREKLKQRGMGDAGSESLNSSYWAPEDSMDSSIDQQLTQIAM